MKYGIIFDMDGTLWDSAENVAKAWTEIVKKEYPERGDITTEQIEGVMGLTMVRIAEELFGDIEDTDKRMKLLNDCCNYENEYLSIHGGNLYDGLEETLKKLSESFNLYIVSNCQSGYIEAFLEYYGFSKYFSDIECFGNNGFEKGDNIKLLAERNNLEDAVYVGDIQGDYDATMKAGYKFIHAKYGFGSINAEVPFINSIKDLNEEIVNKTLGI